MKQQLQTQKGFSSILLGIISGIVVLGLVAGYFGIVQFRTYQAQQAAKEKQAQRLTSAQQKALEVNQKLILDQQKALDNANKTITDIKTEATAETKKAEALSERQIAQRKVIVDVKTQAAAVTQDLKNQITNIKPAVINNVTPKDTSVNSLATPPANTTLCNGTYWAGCPTGQSFVCPINGNAYCQQPLQQNPQPAKDSSLKLCNGRSWQDCPTGSKFVCPASGDAQCLIDNISSIESWEQIEARDFVYANTKGWTSLISTNALGEKRYYRKEGTQWIRKNTQAEAEQPYESPENVVTQLAFRDSALSTHTKLISILTQYRDMFTADIDGMNNIAKSISDSGTTDERFLLLLRLTTLRTERITTARDATNETINRYRLELSNFQSQPLSYFSVNRTPSDITDFFNRLPQLYSAAIADQDSYSTSVNKVATLSSFIPPAKSAISCSYSNGGTVWSCVDSSYRTTISCFYSNGGTVLNCR